MPRKKRSFEIVIEDGELAGGGFYKVEIIAKLLGVSVRRIQQLTQEGVLKTEQVGAYRRYDLIGTVRAYAKHVGDKAAGKEVRESEAKLKEQKLKAEIALKESQGDLHKLKTEIALGKYISTDEVRLDYAKFFVTFKKFAQSMPVKCANAVAAAADPVTARKIEKELGDELDDMLRSFVAAGVADGNE